MNLPWHLALFNIISKADTVPIHVGAVSLNLLGGKLSPNWYTFTRKELLNWFTLYWEGAPKLVYFVPGRSY